MCHEPKSVECTASKHPVLDVLVVLQVHDPDLPAFCTSLVLVVCPVYATNVHAVIAILFQGLDQERKKFRKT